MLMLDDLKYIHEKDTQDALGVASKLWEQLQYVYDLPELNFEIENIVYAAMGGSAFAGMLSTTWPGYTVPFEIVRGYDIPAYVSDKTLFIACSYSGNTEEAIEALGKAEAKGANIVVIAAGGKLAEIAKAKNYPFAQIPDNFQPRYAVLYMFRALVTVLERAGLVEGEEEGLKAALEIIKQSVNDWRPDVPTANNQAKSLALELVGKSVVIYSGPKLFPAAYKWKISINENAKNLAWCNQLPEFNHNEFIGWTSHPVDKPYAVVQLMSNLEHPRIAKRFEVTNKILSGRWPQPHIVQAQGNQIVEQLLWTLALGDHVSLYMAMLNGLNPTPVDVVEQLKTELNK